VLAEIVFKTEFVKKARYYVSRRLIVTHENKHIIAIHIPILLYCIKYINLAYSAHEESSV